MSTKEKETRYREAIRYMQNATEIVRTKAEKEDKYYQDAKYVKMACGTAYSGLLLATDAYMEMKGKPLEKKKRSRKSVEDYRKGLGSIDIKMLKTFNSAYKILHLVGYYEGETKESINRAGLEDAMDVIEKIKPVGFA
jgi:Domain of unknown function (DUF5618)